jgi:hypothetical protein
MREGERLWSVGCPLNIAAVTFRNLFIYGKVAEKV